MVLIEIKSLESVRGNCWMPNSIFVLHKLNRLVARQCPTTKCLWTIKVGLRWGETTELWRPPSSVTRWWNKMLPNFPQKWPRTFYIIVTLLEIALNVTKIFGLFLWENLLLRACKNRPIWSHCRPLIYCTPGTAFLYVRTGIELGVPLMISAFEVEVCFSRPLGYSDNPA